MVKRLLQYAAATAKNLKKIILHPGSLVAASLALLLLLGYPAFQLYTQHTSNGITLNEFQKCQRQYCEAIARLLNTPIEWHLVLDVSESYVGSRSKGTFHIPTQKISSLVGALPLSRGDAFCLDSFDVEYRPGSCLSNLDLDSIGTEVLRTAALQRLAATLPPPQPLSKSEATDFYRVLRHIAATDVTCRYSFGSESIRRYYLFLTDGTHDPENKKTFLPLFPEHQQTSRFAVEATKIVLPQPNPSAQCPNFGQLVRGLHFVVDQDRALPVVVADWQRGTQALKNTNRLDRPTHPKTRPFLPRITVWDPSLGSPNFSNQISTGVDRNPGIYPCLQDGSVPNPETPHKYPFPRSTLLPPSCGQLHETGYRVALPPSLLSTGDGHIELPFYLLQRGSKNESVRLTLTTEDPVAKHEPKTQRLRSPKETVEEWVPQRVAFTLPVSGSELAAQPLPVKAEYGFGRWEDSSPVLTLHLYSSNMLHIIDHILSWRGMLPIILATLFLIVSWIFLYKSERVEVWFTLESLKSFGKNNDTTQKIKIYERMHRNGVRFHVKEDGTYCGVDELRPYKMPTELDFDKDALILFDIIPFGSVVYCLPWYKEGKNGKIEELDILIPCSQSVKGGALAPRATWVRNPAADNSPAQVRDRICDRMVPKLLRWPKNISFQLKKGSDDKVQYDFELFETFETRRTHHFWKGMFNILAFSSVLVTGFQLWVPDVYGWLLVNSTFLPEALRSYLLCSGLILLLSALFFSLRMFIRPTVTSAGYFLCGGKVYVVTFWTLFFSSWMFVIFSPGTALWFALLGLSAAVAVAPFLLESWWVRKRIESEKSFWISDMVMDSFLALGPIAS